MVHQNAAAPAAETIFVSSHRFRVGNCSKRGSRELSVARPLVALAAVGQLEKLVGDVAPTAGAGARNDGQTWTAIGRALGTTRQAAYQRFSRFLDPELVSNPQD
ncbi:hypothetical protein [Streptomyces sp. NPDC002758]